MPNKDRERAYLARFLAAVPDCPSSPVGEGEAPDFVVGVGQESIGLEFTVFESARLPNAPHPTEQDGLRWRVVGMAERLHGQAGGPPLYVRVRFRERAPLSKRLTTDVARKLQSAIGAIQLPGTFSDGDVEIDGQSLPAQIVSVSIRASLDGQDKLWNPTFGSWVRTASPTDVEAVIQRKVPKLANYRLKAPRVWLVIVNDLFASGDAVELGDEGVNALYDYPFDRVYWLAESGDRAWHLAKHGT